MNKNICLFICFITVGAFVLCPLLIIFYDSNEYAYESDHDMSTLQLMIEALKPNRIITDHANEIAMLIINSRVTIPNACNIFFSVVYSMVCYVDLLVKLDIFGQLIFVTILANYYHDTCWTKQFMLSLAKFVIFFIFTYCILFSRMQDIQLNINVNDLGMSQVEQRMVCFIGSSIRALFYIFNNNGNLNISLFWKTQSDLRMFESDIGVLCLRDTSKIGQCLKWLFYKQLKFDLVHVKMIKYILLNYTPITNNEKYISDLIVSYCISYNDIDHVDNAILCNQLKISDPTGVFIANNAFVILDTPFDKYTDTTMIDLLTVGLTDIYNNRNRQKIEFKTELFSSAHDQNVEWINKETMQILETATVKFNRLTLVNHETICLMEKRMKLLICQYLSNQNQTTSKYLAKLSFKFELNNSNLPEFFEV